MISVLLVICVILGSFGRYFWFADIFSNFAVQYFLTAAIVSAFLFGKRRNTMGIVVLLLCIFQISRVMPIWINDIGASEEREQYEEVSILQYNVFKFNPFKKDATKWLQTKSDEVDIIVLYEVTFDWVPMLEELKKKYPYNKIEPRTDSWGMAVFSKLPYSRIELEYTNDGAPVGILYANTAKNHVPFSVYTVHTKPPVTPGNWRKRNKIFSQVVDLIREDPALRVVMVGDLNVTRYSYWFEKLAANSGLRDSYEGWGIMGSWPSLLPNIFRIAIDHVLVSHNIGISDKSLGKSKGSDHVPVITIMRIPV